MGMYFDTFWFDVGVIWFMILMLYPPLYYEHLRKFVEFLGKLRLFKKVSGKDEEKPAKLP